MAVPRVLDTAFAWSVMNSHLYAADFLLEHGADIGRSIPTNWRRTELKNAYETALARRRQASGTN